MLQAYRGVVVTERDVQTLTEDEAAKVYLTQFWNPVRLGNVPSKEVALVLFAHVVHTGQLSAIKALQKTLNLSFGQKLYIDGIFGGKTEIALSMVKDQKTLARKLIQNIQIYYVEICEARRDQLVFLRGWLNRTFHLSDAIE
jgi:lysozyme family protein